MDSFKDILNNAINANRDRGFFSQYPEHHKAYPEAQMTEGEKAFNDQLNTYFKGLNFGRNVEWIGEEVSPINGKKLGVKYAAHKPETLIQQSEKVAAELKATSITLRAEILIDALERIKDRFFELAHATMHTTGQSFMMAFQASGPHSSDRALEALAMAYEELTRFKSEVAWQKPMGKIQIELKKEYKPIPKGIALAIGCATFPVWNTIPCVFANLMCGNPVIVKPHPMGILPIAIVLSEIQNAFHANRISKEVIQMAVDTPNNPITKTLAENPNVKVIDYTGSTEFGNYIENLTDKTVFTEKSAINSVIIDSSDFVNEAIENLAFAAVLYSGQMCTSPQNIFIGEKGVRTPSRTVSYNEVKDQLIKAVQNLSEHPKMGPPTLANIQNVRTIEQIDSLNNLPNVAMRSINEGNVQKCTPIIIEVDANDKKLVSTEHFGPIIKIVKTRGLDHSLELAKTNAEQHGAITCLAHCNDAQLKAKIKDVMESCFTPVTFNLKGYYWVNQHAAFSDFHVSSGNASGNASFTDPNFVNRRFVWVGHREMM